MPPEPSALPDHLGYSLRAVSNAVSQGFARALAAQGVSVAEWVYLRLIYDAPLAPAAVAGAMGLTRGAITKLTDRLAARGLVLRQERPEDGRGQALVLTEAGRGLVPVLAALADANDAGFFGVLAPAEQAALRALVEKLARHHGLTAVPVD